MDWQKTDLLDTEWGDPELMVMEYVKREGARQEWSTKEVREVLGHREAISREMRLTSIIGANQVKTWEEGMA